MSKPVSDVSIKLISELHDALRGVKADLEAAKLREASLRKPICWHCGERELYATNLPSGIHNVRNSGKNLDGWRCTYCDDWLQITTLKQERDAAQSALEIARTALYGIAHARFSDRLWERAVDISDKALAKIESPSAALAERDRAIEKRTAERCVAIAAGCYYAETATGYIRREFNLELKPEDEVNG